MFERIRSKLRAPVREAEAEAPSQSIEQPVVSRSRKQVWQVADAGEKWTLEDFSVKEIGNEMISAYDTGNKSTVYLVGDTGAIVRFQAHIYEPTWEAFSVTCDIDCLENGEYKGLYRCWSVNESNYHNVVKTSGSCETAEQYIRQKMPNGFYLKYSLN